MKLGWGMLCYGMWFMMFDDIRARQESKRAEKASLATRDIARKIKECYLDNSHALDFFGRRKVSKQDTNKGKEQEWKVVNDQ